MLTPALAAIALTSALGRSPTAWARMPVRWWPLVVGSFAVELILYNPPIDAQGWAIVWGPWIWVATKFLMLAFVVRNAAARSGVARWPWVLAMLGIALNTAVIVANAGHMPQAPEARVAAWGSSAPPIPDPSVRLENVEPLTTASALTWLGDVIAEPRWVPRPNVISVGDALLALSVAGWILAAGFARRRHTSPLDTGSLSHARVPSL